MQLIARARTRGASPAIRVAGRERRYSDLVADAEGLAWSIIERRGTDVRDLAGDRVAYLCEPGYTWVVAEWAIWLAGGVAVPLAVSHPEAELAYAVDHTGARLLVVDAHLRERLEALAAARGIALVDPQERAHARPHGLPVVAADHRAIIFFTSGTTGRPKGAVWDHRTVEAQAAMLEQAWGWTDRDTILSVLPLHHVHGVINVVTTALWAGATCEILPEFDVDATWDALSSGRITVFMAVPTIYVKLIKSWDAAPPNLQSARSEGARRLRLMVSGSAALPVQVLERWQSITGHRLLERYGMTELGMAISNPLVGERIAGSVGTPMPGVDVRLVDDAGRDVRAGTPGEILVRGPGVFREYWNAPDATRAAFTDGWFRTGDVAVVENGRYRILGRNSTDIIKTGGYKVSALEIEEVLRDHPSVEDCAVIGLPDDEWGQRVAAVIVPTAGQVIELDALRTSLGQRLAPYKLPSRLATVSSLPRNPMGKVVKGDLESLFTR